MDVQVHYLLRLYSDEAALHGDRPVFEVVLERAREAKMLGATIHRAEGGFGHGKRIHRRGFLDHNFPVIIEIVDIETRIRSFWTTLADVAGVGLVTLEKIEVLRGGRPSNQTDPEERSHESPE